VLHGWIASDFHRATTGLLVCEANSLRSNHQWRHHSAMTSMEYAVSSFCSVRNRYIIVAEKHGSRRWEKNAATTEIGGKVGKFCANAVFIRKKTRSNDDIILRWSHRQSIRVHQVTSPLPRSRFQQLSTDSSIAAT